MPTTVGAMATAALAVRRRAARARMIVALARVALTVPRRAALACRTVVLADLHRAVLAARVVLPRVVPGSRIAALALEVPRRAALVPMTVVLARVARMLLRRAALALMTVVPLRAAPAVLRRVVLAQMIVGRNRPAPADRNSNGRSVGPLAPQRPAARRSIAADTDPRLAITAAWSSGSIGSSLNSSNCEANCTGDNSRVKRGRSCSVENR